jgi:pimeloyl-ACP methyl ester carboxylesterase
MFARIQIQAALIIVFGVAATVSAQVSALKRQGYFGAVLRSPSSDRPGAEVRDVEIGSPAAQAGLQKGDTVLSINGKTLNDAVAFQRLYRAWRAGDTLEMEVQRERQSRRLRFTLPPLPYENLEGVDIVYDSITTDLGHRLRSIVTKPKNAKGRLPGLLLVQWMSCDSVERPMGRPDGMELLLQRLAIKSGFVMMRVDKAGVGDSEGPPCVDTDFQHEFTGYRSALRAFKRLDSVDPDRLFIIGISNGGGIAPLVAQAEQVNVRGYIVVNGWVRTYFEKIIEYERARLTLLDLTPSEVSARMRKYAELYALFLEQKMTPKEVIAARPHLASVWYGWPEHQFGRPASFFHQLQELNLEAAWEKIDSPTLVVYGEYDFHMSRRDHEMITEIVNRKRPGSARLVIFPRMDHLLFVHESLEKSFRDYWAGKYDESLTTVIVEWLHKTARNADAPATTK